MHCVVICRLTDRRLFALPALRLFSFLSVNAVSINDTNTNIFKKLLLTTFNMSSSSSSERDRGVRFVDRWTSDRVKEWLKNIDGFVFDCDGVRVF